ncbi:MAG: hypothetical protein ACXWUG_03825 [Polyangiales bacterium]
MKLAIAIVLAAVTVSCGYKPLRSGLRGNPKIRVTTAHASAPGGSQAQIEEEAATGARLELARYGALDDGSNDRLRIEIVRVDERSEGIGASPLDGEGRPHARGVRVRLLARGVFEGASGAFETADVEGSELVASPGDAASWEGARAAAARRAARLAGARVAHEVLGLP